MPTPSSARALLAVAAALLGAGPVAAQVDSSFLAGLTARSVGPAGMSGRISAIDAVAANPNIIYAGTATGGLWKTENGGVTWRPLLDDFPAPSVGAVAIFQLSPDLVWAGTGEKGRRNSSGVGTGVYKTMDGGRTWARVGLEETGAISEIILHPTNPDVAYVAALGNTWGENEQRGVFRTTDGGRTWTKVLYVDARTGAADLVMDPTNPNKLFAAMWEHRRWPWFFNSGGPGSGLHVTWDGGATWTRLTEQDGLPPGNLGRIGLAIARNRPEVVYALVEAQRSVLLRSDDGGRSFRTVNRERGIANRPFYYAQLEVDPENENRVYNIASRVEVSEDGGRSFRRAVPSRVHPDHHAFWIHPHDGRMIIDGNDGGIAISTDRSASWRFVENLPLAQFYHISVDMATPFNILGGLQDNGSWRGPSVVWENGGIRNYHWQEVGFGDGFATLADPADDRLGYAMSQGGNLMRWNRITGERKSIRPAHPEDVELRFNWNAAIAIDPFDNAVYYGSQFIHRSTDRGDSWEIISGDLTTNDPEKQRQLESGGLTYDVTNAENHTTILTIAASPVARGVIWVGTDDGNVQLTRDGGRTWTNVVSRIRGVPLATWVPHIEASKFDSGTAFVVFDDHRRANNAPYVFVTTDFGRSWRSLVTPEITGFVHVIEQDPIERNLLFLGTEFGMYVSLDGGAAWHLWRHGVPRAPVRALVVHPRDHALVIGTHGRAAYVLDDVRPLRLLARDPQLATRALHLFEIPTTTQYRVRQVDGYRFTGDGMFSGENPPYGALLTYIVRSTASTDTIRATVQVLDGSGEVIRTFRDRGRPGINRATWNLRRDGVRGPRDDDDDEPGGFEGTPPGPWVLPGTYTLRIIHRGDTAAQRVDVLADPRYGELTIAERRRKLDALMHVQQRRAVAAETVNRIRTAQGALERALELLNENPDSARRAVRRAGLQLRDSLRAVEEAFMGPEDRQGIFRSSDAAWRLLSSVYGSLNSSWDAPTQAQTIYLRQAEARLAVVLDHARRVLGEQVMRFRERLRAANIEVFPPVEPVSLDWEPDGS